VNLILLIDDNEQIRITFGMVLRTAGYDVIEATSGSDGLQMAREHMPDLILTDINMPGGDGQTLLHQIRTDPELYSKQVVLMTGRPDMVSPRKGMEQGADDFLVKPVKSTELLACVKARLSRIDIHWRVEDNALSKLRTSGIAQLPHEFFTPLAGILGISEIFGMEDVDLSRDEIKDLTRDIRRSAQRLHRTLRNYLLILEPPSPSDDAVPTLSAPEVHDDLQSAVNLVLERHDRKADLTNEWAAVSLSIRSSDLMLIAEEMLDNAFKFSRPGTPVIFHLDEYGLLEVSDHGRGMSAEQIKCVAAFKQFDRKKHEQQGLGLGLSLVQKLTARNHATFALEANAPQGIRTRVQMRVAR